MAYNLDVKKMSKDDWSLANCKERAIYIITNYSKTEKQLRDKLKQGKKYTDEIIDETKTEIKKTDKKKEQLKIFGYPFFGNKDGSLNKNIFYKISKRKKYIKN